MKKLLLSIITFIYLSVSSGIAMEIHYCMGQRAGVDMYATKAGKCSRCGMTEKKGCCNDEHKFYKLTTDQKTVANDHDFHSPVVLHETVYSIPELLFTKNTALTLSNNSPSPGGPPLFILNCTYRL
ncbi:MAG TPA: hypothetical protein VK498_09615 [Ferruginibacter sp.]|nr:hypothetical protein [Ferruginibacter sp.]